MSGSVEIILDGQKYLLKIDEGGERVQHAARLVDEQLARIRATTKVASVHQAALLAALNLALKVDQASHDVQNFKKTTIADLDRLIDQVQNEITAAPLTGSA